MIEVKCEHCGMTRLEPDPDPPRTQEECIQFRKDWDERYERRNNELPRRLPREDELGS